MRSQLLLLILLVSICCRLMNDVVEAKCLEDQKMQLLQLRNNVTYDPEQSTKLTNWDERIDCCQWKGISCNGAGQVIGLNLTGDSFSGSINALANLKYLSVIILEQDYFEAPFPEFLADLSNLTVLSLPNCALTGETPQKIFQMPALQIIDLAGNYMLGGSLPEFPSNGSLQTLALGGTEFSGTLPNSIGNLRMLSYLDLAYANFTGPVPSSLANLSQLVSLDLSSNSFTGSLPSFRLSKNLSRLSFQNNSLSGDISSSHWDAFEKLEYLDLRDNSFSGVIPTSLFFLPSLTHLDLSNNNFSGQLTELQNVSSPLTEIDLSSNNLEGPLPEFLFELKHVVELSLSSNNFSATVKLDKFTKLQNLTKLDLSCSGLSVDPNISQSDLALLPQFSTLLLASCNLQNIPFIKNQSSLMELNLSGNHIKGEIPNWIWEINDEHFSSLNLSHNQFTHLHEPHRLPGSTLFILDLHSNLLSGEIPLPPRSAAFVDFSSNKFATSFPPDYGNHLYDGCWFFSVANNKISGTIPPSICNLIYLQVLDLSNNSLTGRVPTCLAEQMIGLEILSLEGNKLIGNMPGNFSKKCILETLDLSRNRFEGKIPQSLSNCRNLKVLNVGNNYISDTFPCWLSNLPNLHVLVLHSNKFHGNIDCSGVNDSWPALQIIHLASNKFSGSLPRNFFLKLKSMMQDSAVTHSRSDILHYGFDLIKAIYYQDKVDVSLKGLDVTVGKIFLSFMSIDFSKNNFVGRIPETIGELKSLFLLNLSHNAFTGQIPHAVGNLKQLEI